MATREIFGRLVLAMGLVLLGWGIGLWAGLPIALMYTGLVLIFFGLLLTLSGVQE